MLNYSTSEENYIKAIFHLQNGQNTVSTNALAEKLNTKPASVTDMMKKLKGKKLLHYEPYQGFRLSNEGKKVALDIIRRHRLWEYFLAEKLKFKWDEVHAVAEDLEHVSSKKLIDKLDEYLGYPKFDPHGDPIPDSLGKMENSQQISLADLAPNKLGEVCRVINQSEEMLELLKHKKINIGTKLEVKRKFSFDRSIEIKLRQQPPFSISEQLAKNIFVTL
ncbi:MAG TPA: metal-dependent transcriptional regulator [Chitinophagaceae bacterium]|jgi:DtxR family Mn-dependent transcriptional regulator|nr:metal-dependent transcriptional regulator [Chitinophagaceae bacterium]